MDKKSTMKSMNLLALMMASKYDILLPSERGRNNLRPEDIDMTPAKKIIPKGCKVYNIDGKDIVAISEKSAIKKYLKTQNT